MSEELCYSTVTFKTPCNPSLTVKRNEETIYTEVKRSERAAPEPLPVPDGAGTGGHNVAPPTVHSEKAEAGCGTYRVAALSLGILSVLLLLIVALLSAYCCLYLAQLGQLQENNIILAQEKEKLTELNNNLTADINVMEGELGMLKKNSSFLNMILQFHNFPVDLYCPINNTSTNGRTCSPCPTNWTQNNLTCYYVYRFEPWKTWQQSNFECIQLGANLLTIDNMAEQMFINQLAERYFDTWHGYWFGLTTTNNQWMWQNGSLLTEAFWNPQRNWSNPCAITNAGYDSGLYNWNPAKCDMNNRYICENKALVF